MRIGILTQPLRTNYGGILQNWALQQVLLRLGHSPITITYGDFSYGQRLSIWSHRLIYNILFLKKRHQIMSPRWWEKTCKKMYEFCKAHINVTKGIATCAERNWRSDRVDAYIVGSDQVWRPRYNKAPGQLIAMYGGYVPSGKALLAYAASFGTDEWEYTPEQTAEARKLIRRFKAISVRETGAIRLCRQHLDVESDLVLDPTLLLNADDYSSLITAEARSTVPVNALGVFFLDPTPEKHIQATQMAQRLGLVIHVIGATDDNGNKASIESWLAAFENCSHIITDSFHGTVFSILYHRPFTTIINEDRGADRITSLLALVNLPDRTSTTAAADAIDWQAVDSRLAAARPASQSFLQMHLA
ncbi:MAG: polysaccharide pyruvyl transferase family protein [Bacteroides sp.]|nr:polysaccharide pyruvyl transferase family protein [Bacteroides sp.]MCM1094716.1 polysaccharide pyruvyl transferase family protein [Terasakiella sp.]